MASSDTAKPATAETVNGLRNVEQLSGRLDCETITSLRTLQAIGLTRRCAISFALATAIASVMYGEARQ